MRETDTVFVILMLVSAFTVGAALTGAATASTETPTETTGCATSVLHDSFRFNNDTIETVKNGSTAESIRDNTRVTLTKTDAFYKLKAENPNSYCVAFTVMVSSRAMSAATFPAGVTSNDGNHTANWSSTYDFSSDTRYTEISFVLGSDTSATFAPNRGAVASMSLATRSSDRAEGALGNLTSKLFGNDTQIKHTYYVQATNNTSQVRIKLTHPQTGEPIKKYNVVYSMDNKTWNKVPTSTGAPVYKRVSDDGKYLVLHFSKKAQTEGATVRFTANPTIGHELRDGFDTWWSGWDGVFGDDDGG